MHIIDSSGNSSIARDLNESGRIAGYSSSPRKATMSTLASGSASAQTLSNDSPSEAHALDNDSSPHVVGFRTITDDEVCPPVEFYDEAFQWVPGGSVSALGAIGSQTLSAAFDIRRNGSEVAVGESSPCRPWNACLPGQVGTAWTSTSGAAIDVGEIRESEAGNDRESHPYGINDDQRLAGWVQFKPTGTINCFPTAAFWESPSDTDPVDLADFLENEGDISRAYAINSLEDPQVVGEDVEIGHAVLWEYGSPSWTSTDLNDSPEVIADCSDDQWFITEAHDINDNGWIVALGETIVSSTIQYHALLLTPVQCPLDVNEDGDIDENEGAAILGVLENPAWLSDACPTAMICRWDVNFNCKVTRDDLEAVLDYLETCSGDPCPCEGEGFGPGAGLLAERYAAAIAAHQPELTEEQVALGWECFFEVYLD